MAEVKATLRDPTAADEASWRSLWSNYNAFYGATLPDIVTAHTWHRILDPASSIFCRLATVEDNILGFSVSVLHDGTWALAPICYLEDLFVAPLYRGQGIGRLMIQDLVDRANVDGWSRLYWHTRENNPARRLYDEFVEADDFVRYRLIFS